MPVTQVFRYDLPSGRYYAVGQDPHTESMLSNNYYKEPFKPVYENPWTGVVNQNPNELNDNDLF